MAVYISFYFIFKDPTAGVWINVLFLSVIYEYIFMVSIYVAHWHLEMAFRQLTWHSQLEDSKGCFKITPAAISHSSNIYFNFAGAGRVSTKNSMHLTLPMTSAKCSLRRLQFHFLNQKEIYSSWILYALASYHTSFVITVALILSIPELWSNPDKTTCTHTHNGFCHYTTHACNLSN